MSFEVFTINDIKRVHRVQAMSLPKKPKNFGNYNRAFSMEQQMKGNMFVIELSLVAGRNPSVLFQINSRLSGTKLGIHHIHVKTQEIISQALYKHNS